jgi:hypothetical protein
MSTIRKTLAALIVAAAFPVQANADAGFDQETVYKALRVNIAEVAGKKCTIFSNTDAEQTLHGPVVRVTAGTGKWTCAYELAKPETAGIRVWREPRSDWQPPHPNGNTSQISHVKGVGQDAYTYFFYVTEGGGWAADVLTAKGVTRVVMREAGGNSVTALRVARMLMNR